MSGRVVVDPRRWQELAARPPTRPGAAHDPVVGPSAALLPADESGVYQLLRVVGDSRLAKAYGLGEVADARFGVVVRGDEGHEPHAGRIPECLKIRASRSAAPSSSTPAVTGLQQAARSPSSGSVAVMDPA